MIFGAHMKILFKITMKILMLIKWLYMSRSSSQICRLLSLEQSLYFEHTNHYIFKHVSSWYLFLDIHTNHIPLEHGCLSKISNWIRHMYFRHTTHVLVFFKFHFHEDSHLCVNIILLSSTCHLLQAREYFNQGHEITCCNSFKNYGFSLSAMVKFMWTMALFSIKND